MLRIRKALLALTALGALVLGALALLLLTEPAHADEGWTITDFRSAIRIEQSGQLDVTETIRVDFGNLQKHGIFRDIPVLYDYDQHNNRVINVTVQSVTDATNAALQYRTSRQGPNLEIKIGDPNRLISGPQTYNLSYTVKDALNAYSDHDELYWNVNGPNWGVPTNHVLSTVQLPAAGLTDATCYQGASGSTEQCRVSKSDTGAQFESSRSLAVGEQLTVVVGMKKGLVASPHIVLQAKPRPFLEYFTLNPATIALTLIELIALVGWVLWMWWTRGRDREYSTAYYQRQDPGPEHIRPLFRPEPVVAEYRPPDDLRPAQLGLILDESADTKDVTATIVDMAVRGYLRIEELPHNDWNLVRTDKQANGLLPYEVTILDGLFHGRDGSVRLSQLKDHFRSTLDDAESSLYEDSMRRRWFAANPFKVRMGWAVGGIFLAFGGLVLALALGALAGLGLLGLPVILAGLLLAAGSGLMPRRTGIGRDVFQRTLGFRLYMNSAEKDQQKFAEQQNLFTQYLPYAIVFGCVHKWANAFKGLDATQATSSWYVGRAPFSALVFSSTLQDFSGQLSSAIVSVPAAKGSSGFGGGGFSGGGFGGGGGGSW